MSVHALSAAFGAKGLTPSEKLVLLSLANYADEDLSCWPSQRRIASDTSLSDRTVRSVLCALEEKGLITRQERLRQDGSRASDAITLTFAAPAQISGGAETISGGVRKQSPGGAEAASGLTTFEPSPEPSKEPRRAARTEKKPSDSEIEAIWAAAPRIGRERSSRGELETALRAAKRRGHDPAKILAGVKAAYASTTYAGEHAKGVHRLVESDRWASFLDDPTKPAPAEQPPWNGPPEVLADLRSYMGPDRADGYLRFAKWDAERHAIVGDINTITGLKRNAEGPLKRAGVKLIEEQAA